MQNTNDAVVSRGSAEARAWSASVAKKFGQAVRDARESREWSAVQLAAHTAELGYPITRGTIAKIEGGHRGGKVDIAEIFVLAASLNIPPIALIVPGLPEGECEILPSVNIASADALRWITAERADLMWFADLPNPYAEEYDSRTAALRRISDYRSSAEAITKSRRKIDLQDQIADATKTLKAIDELAAQQTTNVQTETAQEVRQSLEFQLVRLVAELVAVSE